MNCQMRFLFIIPPRVGEHQRSVRELVWQDGKVADRIIEDLGY